MNSYPPHIAQILAQIRARPTQPELYARLGQVCLDAGYWVQAAEALARAVELTPVPAPRLRQQLGLAQMQIGQLDEAETQFRAALDADPNAIDALFGLAPILTSRGDFVAAADTLRRVIRQDPLRAQAHQQLAFATRYQDAGHPDIVQMRRTLVDPALTDDGCETVSFALGKALDDCAEYAEAFTCFKMANALQRKRLGPFDRDAYRALIDANIGAFDAAWFERARGERTPGLRPIFIIGLPRSGTTLIEQILSSHPLVHGGGELPYIVQISLAALPDFPSGLSALSPEDLRRLAAEYLRLAGSRLPGIEFVSDKHTGNFQYLGMIATLFPDSPIVHVQRDPLDNGLSLFQQDFKQLNRFTNDLGDIAFVYRQYERLMAHWRETIPNSVHEVRYETFVDDADTSVPQLVAACGLPWHDDCLAHTQNPRAVLTLSSRQVREPVYTTSVGRWRHYANELAGLRNALVAH